MTCYNAIHELAPHVLEMNLQFGKHIYTTPVNPRPQPL